MFCPMCGHVLLTNRKLVCSWVDCIRPTAAAEILGERELDHIVTFTADGWSMKHPLRERLDDALLSCEVTEWLAREPEPPFGLGTYRLQLTDVHCSIHRIDPA